MELDITAMVSDDVDLMDYSASIAEIGANAGPETWNNALNAEINFVNDENRDELKDYIREFGAWKDSEIDAWNDTELNALVLQLISGDLREYLHFKDSDEFEEWQENNGGRIFEAEGKFYYYIGI